MKKFVLLSFLLVAGGVLTASNAQAEICRPRSRWANHDWHHRHGGFYGSTRVYAPPHEVRYVKVVQETPVDSTVVVNIPNANGSYTPVVLRHSSGVYVGPRGEQYLNMPSVEQLKSVYGLQ